MRIHLLGAIVLVSAFLVPISPAYAAEFSTATAGGYFSSDTHGCGSMKVFVPNENQFTAQVTGFNKKSISLRERALSKMQGRKIHWLTSMTCQPGLAHHALTSTSRRGSSPSAVDGAVNWTPNWSGYVNDASGAIGVTQDWVQPILNDGDSGAFVDSSIWPGIGGFNNDVLVQAGTDILGSCSGNSGCDYQGSPYFWIEALPDNPTELEVTNLTVHLGDDVSALVDFDYSTHTAEFQLCNNVLLECVDGSHAMNNGADPGPTVEWIAERADFSGTLPELNNFGQLTIESAEWGDTGGQTQVAGGTAYTMQTCDGSQELAVPGSIGYFSNGPYFNDQFTNYGHSDRDSC